MIVVMVVVMVILRALYSRTRSCFCSKGLGLVLAALILAGLQAVPGEAGTLSASDSGQAVGQIGGGEKSRSGGSSAPTDSLATLERRLKVNPYDIDTLAQKARLLMNLHRPKEAIAVINIAIKK